MKLRTVLNGIIALAVVGAFYTFSFCMVDDIDTTEISQEYYYNTATDTTPAVFPAETINNIAETTYENIKEVADNPLDEDNERIDAQIRNTPDYADLSDNNQEVNSGEISVTPLVDTDAAVTTVVPSSAYDEISTESAGADNSQTAEKELDSSYSDEELSDDEGDEVIESENRLESDKVEDQDAYADNNDDNSDLLSELDRDPTAEEIKQTLSQMQQEITAKEQETTTIETTISGESGFITSDGTYFETTGTFIESDPTHTEISTSRPDGTEIFTVKIDGTVQEYDAYQLVCMIVSTEMSPSFNTEALKAQAIAAYSYVKYHNVNGLVPSVLVKYQIPNEVSAAVSSVWGKCCYYNGKVAQTVYTASTAGKTASAENVWGGSLPYLKSVDTPFDITDDPNYGVVTTYSEADVRQRIERTLGITLSDNPENWFNITERVDGNYVKNVLIDGQITVSGRKIRESVFSYKLKSWCFDVSYSNGYFTFTTYGYGHGVGMSQNGANILGKQGYTYDEILKFYFPGIVVE